MTLFQEQDTAFHKFMLFVRMDRIYRFIIGQRIFPIEPEYLKEHRIMKEMNE